MLPNPQFHCQGRDVCLVANFSFWEQTCLTTKLSPPESTHYWSCYFSLLRVHLCLIKLFPPERAHWTRGFSLSRCRKTTPMCSPPTTSTTSSGILLPPVRLIVATAAWQLSPAASHGSWTSTDHLMTHTRTWSQPSPCRRQCRVVLKTTWHVTACRPRTFEPGIA